jgi:hypothetical protein
VTLRAEPEGENAVALVLETSAFLQSVRIACDGFEPDDNYFHAVPGHAKRIVLRALGRTLTAAAEANRLRDDVYEALHQGAVHEWAAR